MRLQKQPLDIIADVLRPEVALGSPDAISMNEKVKAGKLTVKEHAYYATIDLASQTNKDFLTKSDDMVEGIRNIQKQQLGKDEFFILTSVQFLAGVAASDSSLEAQQRVIEFDGILSHEELVNAELTLEVNGDKKVFDRIPMSIFDTSSKTDVAEGEHILAFPKLVYPQTDLQINVKSTGALKALLVGKVILKGFVTKP